MLHCQRDQTLNQFLAIDTGCRHQLGIHTDIGEAGDGIQFIKELRNTSEYKFTPIIVLTTENQDSKMQEGRAAGATGWIVKPFSSDKLIAVVKKILG